MKLFSSVFYICMTTQVHGWLPSSLKLWALTRRRLWMLCFFKDGLITVEKAGGAEAISLLLLGLRGIYYHCSNNWTLCKMIAKIFSRWETEGYLKNYESGMLFWSGFGFPFQVSNVKLMGVFSVQLLLPCLLI